MNTTYTLDTYDTANYSTAPWQRTGWTPEDRLLHQLNEELYTADDTEADY